MLIEVMVPGTCGQIAQGWKNGKPFQITCPVELYSRVLVTDSTSAKSGFGQKSHQAMRATCEYLGERHSPYGMALESQLPSGKGLGSSSADISAVIAATGAAFGEYLLPEEIAELAAEIEPTDGVCQPGIANVNYITGELYKQYDDVPKMIIGILDTQPDSDVNKVDFHAHLAENKHPHDSSPELLSMIDKLSRKVTPELLGEIATMSARENQRLMEKENYEEILAYAKELGSLGVCVAHVGTMIGIMWAPDYSMKKAYDAVDAIVAKFPKLEKYDIVRMTSGGVKVRRY